MDIVDSPTGQRWKKDGVSDGNKMDKIWKQDIIRNNISMSLLCIVSQQLIPNKQNSRTLAAEVLINTNSIKALIRENNIHQIDNYILSGSKDGMIKMDNSILSLFKDQIISKEEALNYAINPNELAQKLSAPNI